MAVCVDPLFSCVPNRKWRFNQACHLVVDNGKLEDLHAFAALLGLKREWFQSGDSHRLPHYDLTEGKRKQAVRMGAREIDRQELVAIMRSQKPDPKQGVLGL